MLTIHLSNLKFYGYHGLYPQEKKVGGEFLVQADVEITEPAGIITSLEESVSYVAVYDIIKRRMQIPTPLLETIAMELADEILAIPLVKKVSLRIIKMAAPVINFEGQLGVSYTKEITN